MPSWLTPYQLAILDSWPFFLALFSALLAFFIGSGVGYNYGLAERLPEAQAILDKATAERRRAAGHAATARRAAGDL